jgi:hydrogenase small subunit
MSVILNMEIPMALKDQFENFCMTHKCCPDFGSLLVGNFGANLPPNADKPYLIWLEANACSGDSISTLNAVDPDLGQLICQLLNVRFWNALMPDEGKQAQERLFETINRGGYILIVEGAIATAGQGRYAVFFKSGDYLFTSAELIPYAAKQARYILAVGTCATFGGPSAARPNPSLSKGVWEVIEQPVLNVSGCPINPDWLIASLVHLLLFGMPEVDRYRRPTFLYGQTIHSICQRRSYYDTGVFAKQLGDPECMFSLGCMGPVTGADCAYRLWNDHLNWPVKAGTPCIGCTKAGFPDKATPFYTPLPGKLPGRSRKGELTRDSDKTFD